MYASGATAGQIAGIFSVTEVAVKSWIKDEVRVTTGGGTKFDLLDFYYDFYKSHPTQHQK